MADNNAADKSATPAAKTCNKSANTNRWRVNRKKQEQALIDAYNKRRAKQNLPPVSLNFEHVVPFRGGALPQYFPPPEQAEKMTDKELQIWRSTERKKRKAEAMRKNRKAKKALIQHIKLQLLEEENISAEEVGGIVKMNRDSQPNKESCVVPKLEQENDTKSPAQLSGDELSKFRRGESETITLEEYAERQVHGETLCLKVQDINKDRFLGTLLSKERIQTHFSAAVSADEKIGQVVDKRRGTFNTLVLAAENFTGVAEKLEHSDAIEDAKNLLAFKRSPRLEI